jgi:hypothetical protein
LCRSERACPFLERPFPSRNVPEAARVGWDSSGRTPRRPWILSV